MVGKSKITMYANGEIIIEGDDIDITGTEHVEIIAPKIYINDGKTEVIKKAGTYKAKLWSLPNQTGIVYSGMPYTLYGGGAMMEKGISEKDGGVSFKLKEGIDDYEIHLPNGYQYKIGLKDEHEGTNDEKLDQELSMKGWIDYKEASNHQVMGLNKSRIAQDKAKG
jgi:hypothetical protein